MIAVYSFNNPNAVTNLNMVLNADAGANYSNTVLTGAILAHSGGDNSIHLAATNTANRGMSGLVWIKSRRQGAENRSHILGTCATQNLDLAGFMVGVYQNLPAGGITRVELAASANIDGRIRLYGYNFP